MPSVLIGEQIGKIKVGEFANWLFPEINSGSCIPNKMTFVGVPFVFFNQRKIGIIDNSLKAIL
jgi:hypothetical protein